ncbi:hypothetical protein C8F01DRAFT_177764 [Mycena amicta]|nr:hypothetical protein C8F01DRAFT_177764 [Mycena amicta]
MPELPQEILDAIVDHIQNIQTLQSGALAGTRLLQPCQRNLFRKLRLYAEYSSWRPTLRAAATFFSAVPHLRPYVRDLNLDLSASYSDSAALEFLFVAFPNVERLIISGRSMTWTSLASGVSKALLECIARPSLQRLHIRALSGISRDALALVLSVPVVALSYASIDNEDPSEAELIVQPRLRHLILTDTDLHGYEFLRERGYLKGLKQLELELDSQQSETDTELGMDKLLLSTCADSLEHVVLSIGYLPHAITIPTLPHVRTAVLQVGVDSLWIPASPPFPRTLANAARALPALEHLSLHFLTSGVRHEPPWDELCGFPASVFGVDSMRTEGLPCLKSVHCRLLYPGRTESQPGLLANFTAAMQMRMPGLKSSGVRLVCDIGTQPSNSSRLP